MSLMALALVAAVSSSYDCTLAEPRALTQDGDKTSLNPINFPGVAEGAWRFNASVKQDKNGINIDVVWPSNPIQIAGKFAGLPTADGAIVFSAFSMGPCMFTESACISLVNLVDAGDGTAKVIILPASLATDKAANAREPFVVVIEGKCTRTDKPK